MVASITLEATKQSSANHVASELGIRRATVAMMMRKIRHAVRDGTNDATLILSILEKAKSL